MATDDEDLGILVRLAASGELSPADVADVERLIADRPDLVAQYERATRAARLAQFGDSDTDIHSGIETNSNSGTETGINSNAGNDSTDAYGDEAESDVAAYTAHPSSPRAHQSGPSGCLVGIGAFVLTVVVMATIGIVMRSRSGAPDVSNSPVQAVLDDPNNEVLRLSGPSELVELGALALMYSPTTGDAVLLGQDIVSGGELFGSDAPGDALASFRSGDVEVLVADLNPDQTLTVTATDS